MTADQARHVRSAALACGAGLLAGSWWAARDTTRIPGWEAGTTQALTGLPGSLSTALWPVMQTGNLWMAAALPAGMYLWRGQGRPTLAAAVAPLAAWASAKVVKATVGRGRPADYLDDVVVREKGLHGHGYVSGHAAVAFASAGVVAAYLPPRRRALPFAVAAVTGFARVQRGAHLPLDVVGGAGLGLVCAAAGLAVGQAPSPAAC